MCLILFAVNPNDKYRLIVAANRDELYARPTVFADFWADQPDMIAGKDENMGGTWLGITRGGRFSAVTNFREQPPEPMPPLSRGDLPLSFLTSEIEPMDYLADVQSRGDSFRGFNLLVADPDATCYYGNRAGAPRTLASGYYGLSNQLLDCDWPKVGEGREQLRALIESGTTDSKTATLSEPLFDLLQSDGDSREFSNSFIKSELYGTRAATVVIIEKSGSIYFEERNFGLAGRPIGGNRFTLQACQLSCSVCS